MSYVQYLRTEGKTVWQTHPFLAITAISMVVAFVFSVAGILLDPRLITGSPAWLKPAKFAISTAIYAATVGWMLRYVTIWPRMIRILGNIVASVLVLEVGIIYVQAARGTSSHFNLTTPLNGALFGIMGIAIMVLWIASLFLLLALFRQSFADPAWGAALRGGLLITVIGAGLGGLMVHPPTQQKAAAPLIVGSHTFGGVDGGPGMTGIGWSTEHGDMRVPHFFGLHGIQVVPLLGLLISRRRAWSTSARTAMVWTVTASYTGLVAILTWQALRGEPLVHPSAATGIVLGVWLGITLGLVGGIALKQKTTLSDQLIVSAV